MTLVYSLWTAPPTYALRRGNIMIQSYALAMARKFYPIKFCHDQRGGKIASMFGWEFDTTETCLDDFDHAGLSHIWALGKIQAILCQSGPCLHIDGDVILTKPLPADFLNAGLVAQSVDFPSWYESPYMIMARRVAGFPDCTAYNTGVFGGNNWPLVTQWAQFAMNAARRFRDCPIEGGMVSMTVEQSSMGCFAAAKPTTLFEGLQEPYEENATGYRHYVTGLRTLETAARLESEFSIAFPDEYARFLTGWQALGGDDGKSVTLSKLHPLLS